MIKLITIIIEVYIQGRPDAVRPKLLFCAASSANPNHQIYIKNSNEILSLPKYSYIVKYIILLFETMSLISITVRALTI